MLSHSTGVKLSLYYKKKRLFLGADLSLWQELFFSDLLGDGGRMGESREGMRKELLSRLVQACASKCQALEGGMSGVCGKKAHGIASTYRSSGIPSPAKAFPKMCGAPGRWGGRLPGGWKAQAREGDWTFMQLCRKTG